MQNSYERIKLMKDAEIVARDAVLEKLKATNDPVAIAGLVAKFEGHCMAVGAFVMALEEIEKEDDER